MVNSEIALNTTLTLYDSDDSIFITKERGSVPERRRSKQNFNILPINTELDMKKPDQALLEIIGNLISEYTALCEVWIDSKEQTEEVIISKEHFIGKMTQIISLIQEDLEPLYSMDIDR